MYFLELSTDGTVVTRYSTEFNDNIPLSATVVTKEEFEFSITNPLAKYVNGAFVSSNSTLSEDIEEMITKVKDLRESHRIGGIYIQSEDKWYHSDDASRTQFIALMLLGANIPSDLMWKTMDGTFIQMTQTLVQTIFQTMITVEQSNYANAEIHINNIRNSTTPKSHDYSTGWIAKYEG